MLKYLVQITEDLSAAAVVIGFLFAFSERYFHNAGRVVFRIINVAGLIAAAVMAILKNTTNKIDTTIWNWRIFALYLAALVVFLILSYVVSKGKASIPGGIAAGTLSFSLIIYFLPDVYAYPYTFILSGQKVFSTEFLYRLIGYSLGIILCVVILIAAERGGKALSKGLFLTVLYSCLLVFGVRFVTSSLQGLLARRIIPSNHNLFMIAKFSANKGYWFTYLILLISLIPAVWIWITSFRVNESYSNPAEHRKIRAKWRFRRRWACTLLVTFFISMVNLIPVKAYINKPFEIAPIEDAAKVDDENVWVSFDQLEDGHLHRFAYKTDKGIEVRFIIIKKPNSSAYGVGLDACDICGETGYYEKKGQVVCKLCDVVMNIQTIGFKGGCNPIVIPYKIEDGYIKVAISGLEENQDEFK